MCFSFETPDLAMLSKRGFVFVIDGNTITDQLQLFRVYGQGLNAPNGYFGENWNAFLDCFGYLDWLKTPEVIVVHRDLPHLSCADIKVYVHILRHAVLRLADKELDDFELLCPELVPYRLTVFFPAEFQSTVLSLLDAVS